MYKKTVKNNPLLSSEIQKILFFTYTKIIIVGVLLILSLIIWIKIESIKIIIPDSQTATIRIIKKKDNTSFINHQETVENKHKSVIDFNIDKFISLKIETNSSIINLNQEAILDSTTNGTFKILKDETKLNIDDNVNPSTTATTKTLLKSSTSTFKKSKMPRVTLKLRKNETIPQMYMESGITSYKKGNITTSVLAHDLSLQGLIFKTPEGTIKPWNKQSTSYENFKKFEKTGQLLLGISVIFMGLSLLMVYVIVISKMIKHKLSHIEDPLVY